MTKDKGRRLPPERGAGSGRQGTHVPDSVGDALEEIRQLYFKTTKATIDRDFDRAIDLLKTMPGGERERATVFMQGLAEMRKEFKKPGRRPRPGRKP